MQNPCPTPQDDFELDLTLYADLDFDKLIIKQRPKFAQKRPFKLFSLKRNTKPLPSHKECLKLV